MMSKELLDEGVELVFLDESDEPVDDLTVLDGDDGGHGLDVVVQGQVRQVVDVDHCQMDLSVCALDGCLKPGCQKFAGSTPRGLKVNDDGVFVAHDFVLELFFVLDGEHLSSRRRRRDET